MLGSLTGAECARTTRACWGTLASGLLHRLEKVGNSQTTPGGRCRLQTTSTRPLLLGLCGLLLGLSLLVGSLSSSLALPLTWAY